MVTQTARFDPATPAREHFIPLRTADLVEFLCGDGELPSDAEREFRELCRGIIEVFHFEFHRRLEELKTAYAPFDPDADTVPLTPLPSAEKRRRQNDLLSAFSWLLDRANFKHLSRTEIEPSLLGASEWGLHTHVDFSIFEYLAMFVRGDTVQRRTRRSLKTLYQEEALEVPVYQRLVLILKMKADEQIGPKGVRTDAIYLKVFKDIPKLDINMLLPGARVRMSALDHGRISLPLLSGIGTAMLNAADDVVRFIAKLGANPTWALWGIATGAFGYGSKSFFSYLNTRQKYHLALTQSLYYQNLDSNLGVLFRLFGEAEEQECRETILAYFMLWRHGGEEGWTVQMLQEQVERFLAEGTPCKVDFEIHDTLPKLERLGLAEHSGDRFRARPLPAALESLLGLWRAYFRFGTLSPDTGLAPSPPAVES